MPRKTFTAGEVLAAADVNTFLMDQSVMTFADSAARGSAIPSPTEGMVTYLDDSKNVEVFDGTNFTSISSSPSGNAVINGAFDIWQRGTSFTNLIGDGTGRLADRYFITYNGTGWLSTITREAFTSGDSPSNQLQYFLRYAVSNTGSGNTLARLQTRIEDVYTFTGGEVTLSFYAKAATAISITPSFQQRFGSGGSANVDTTGSAINVGTSWARYTQTITLPSIAGKTIGADNNLALRFSLPISTFTLDITGIQLEAGSTATPFRQNANSIQGELAACQRYYFRNSPGNLFGVYGFGTGFGSTGASIGISLPVPMRVPPTSVEFSNLQITDMGTNIALTNLSFTGDRTQTFVSVDGIVASGATAFRPYFLRNNNNAAGFIGFSAEL
jgi:hypothetical protein